jgi:hypothetical protein
MALLVGVVLSKRIPGRSKLDSDVDMMNIVKYDTNKRWVIQNLGQQEMGNL